MNENLKDPNKAAHEIVEVRADGDAVRNDGMVLQAANKNPWYVLATIYGEQGKDAFWKSYDVDLAAKNRRAWNGWFCADLDAEGRAYRAKHTNLEVRDLLPLSDEELVDIRKRFCERLDSEVAELPPRDRDIVLSCAQFSRSVILEGYIFERPCDFDFSIFAHGANFELAIFVDTCSFRSSIFQEVVSFRNAQLVGSASFDAVNCFEDAYFVHAQFHRGGSFAKAEFGAAAGFWDSKFYGPANFHLSLFGGNANFTDIHFDTTTLFREAIFSGQATFDRTVFLKQAALESAKFKSRTSFRDTQFKTHVPEFHAAELYDDTVFTLPDKYRKNWPPLKGKGVMKAPEQKRAYNRLRLFMNRSLQIEEEQFFHRQEMRCKSVMAKWYSKHMYWLFAGLSDYGNSVMRPVVWLGASVIAGMLFMLWWQGVFTFTPQNDAGIDWSFGLLSDVDAWVKSREAAGWSLSNSLPFLGFGKLYYGVGFAKDLAWPLRVVGGAQTLLGYSLLFLLGLGLRNRFRLR